MTADSAAVTVLTADGSHGVDDVRLLLRGLVETAAGAGAGSSHRRADGTGARTWVLLGEIDERDRTDQQRVVDHDLLGRQAVRLAIDKIVCIGESRMVRALHQGAVMEGSWGDEVTLCDSVGTAVELLRTDPLWRPGSGDVIMMAGGYPADELLRVLREDLRLDVIWPSR